MAVSPARISITVEGGGERFELALFPGTEPAALVAAVSSRTGLEACEFFCTIGSRDAPVVPLAAALPDGTALTLHACAPAAALAAPPPAAESVSSSRVQRTPRGLPPRGYSGHPTDSLAADSHEEPPVTPLAAPLLPSSGSINGGQAAEARGGLDCLTTPFLAVRPSFWRAGSKRDAAADAVSNQICELERMNRMSTDLANERTLLAWNRTALAAIRTAFAFMSVKASTPTWKNTVIAAECAMGLIALLCARHPRRVRAHLLTDAPRRPPAWQVRRDGRVAVLPHPARLRDENPVALLRPALSQAADRAGACGLPYDRHRRVLTAVGEGLIRQPRLSWCARWSVGG